VYFVMKIPLVFGSIEQYFNSPWKISSFYEKKPIFINKKTIIVINLWQFEEKNEIFLTENKGFLRYL